MGKLHKSLRNIILTNASIPKGSSGGNGNISREPKIFRVARVGLALITGSGSGRDNFETPETDFELIDNVIKKDSYAARSYQTYKELVLKSGYTLKWKNQQAYDYLKSRMDYMAEATDLPTELLFQGIIDDLTKYSNAFIVKARSKKGVGVPAGMNLTPVLPSKEVVAGYFLLPPKTVTISRDKDGTILKYRQEIQGSGDPIDFNPEDVHHITINQETGNAFGTPYIAPVIEDIRLLRKIEENVAMFIYRHIFPLLKYSVGESTPGKEATEDEIETAQMMLSNISADGGIVLPERHKLESLNIQAIDMSAYLTYFENRVLSGLAITQVDMGRGDTANRSTADAMSDNKVDRIKSWQKIIQAQLTNTIIDELLIEGGFDPLSNVDFKIEFTFNEIENEKRIALENHTIQKWNNDLLTFEEARLEIGQDPVADEERLRSNFINVANAQIDDTTNVKDKAVDNKDKPENQHGKKSAPKESQRISMTEKAFSMLYDEFNLAIEDYKESVFKISENENKQISYESSINLSMNNISTILRNLVKEAFNNGRFTYRENTGKRIQVSMANSLITESIDEWFTRFEKDLRVKTKDILEQKQEVKYKKMKLVVLSETFEMRFKMFSENIYKKSKEYGYLLCALNDNTYDFVYIESDNGCNLCKENALNQIEIKSMSELEKRVLFSKIPPYHANCKCRLQGGEYE